MRETESVTFPIALGDFSEIIDVRSPSEYEEDHLPGAVNLPVLGDESRSRVGTDYKQIGSFEARRLGAGLISENIARHFREHFHDKPRDYAPLVYCWRGGQRSRSLATVLRAVGWKVRLLEGGYKAYRRWAIDRIAELGSRCRFRMISGLTGSGKTELLCVLGQLGNQVLDLEGLANHKGSLLGGMPDSPQPSQKRFESRLLSALELLDLDQSIYVESESRKVGNLSIPDAVWESMRAAAVARIHVSRQARAEFLLDDYDYFFDRPDELVHRLRMLREKHGARQIHQWEAFIEGKMWPDLVNSLLEVHYDPLYSRSSYFPSPVVEVDLARVEHSALEAAARRMIQSFDEKPAVADPTISRKE